MTKQQFLSYCLNTYGTSPDYPFDEDFETAVLRHADNKKWYAIVMKVSRRKFGIDSDEDNTVTGWVTSKLGALPNEGDTFVDGNLSVTLLLTDERCVAKAQITILPDEDEDEGEDKPFKLFKRDDEE